MFFYINNSIIERDIIQRLCLMNHGYKISSGFYFCCTCDKNCTIEHIDREFYDKYPIASDADKSSLLDLIHKNDRPGFKDRINYALLMESPFSLRARINSHTDDEVIISLEGRVSKISSGTLLFGTIKDVVICNEEKSLNVITGKWEINIPDGRIFLDKDWLTLFEFSGNPCEVDFNMWLDRLHPEDLSSAVSTYLKFLRGETEEYQDEFRLKTGKGGWKWVLARGWITEKDYKGHPAAISGIHIDIDYIKIREANLLEVQKIAGIGTWSYIIDKDILKCSDECKKIFNADDLAENFRYNDLLAVLHQDSMPLIEEHYRLISKNKDVSDTIEIKLFFPGSIIKHVFVSYRTERDSNNNIYITGLVQDITTKKEYENILIEARNKAQESDRLKSAFLANMSHEIRTPLNSIIGFARIIAEEKLSRKEKDDYHRIIQSNTDQLLSLVNDILDSAKIENGEFEIYRELFSVNELIHETNSVFHKRIKSLGKNKINIHFEIPEDSDNIFLFTDRNRILQVFNNLISNAVKFTDSGIIKFGYTKLSLTRLLFFVEDTGPGINKKNLDLIFERFRQEDESMSRKHDGAGLGLNIVRNILKILGTDISVESEKGKGSRFFFEMDYKTVETSVSKKKTKRIKIDPAVREDLKEKQVLIVDDHELSYRFTSSLLNKAGINTMYACSGTEALQILSDRDMIDLVLLDIQMPGMDGLEVLSRIKEKQLKLPVIAQTAHALSGDREKYLSCGFSDYLSKPIDRNELISKILSFLSKK